MNENYGSGRIKKLFSENYLLLFVILFGIILRLYFFNGIRDHDDWVYLFYVRSYINGTTEEMFNSLWGMRLIFIFFSIFLFKIFHPSFLLAFLPTFTLSILEIILI